MYGSHNSLTGYKPIKWWGRLLQPFARCQRTTVEEQIEGGARAFDLRVRFDGKDGLVACHGLVEYKADVPAVVARLENAGCCYRIILENVMGERCVSADDLDRLKAMFLDGEHPHCLYVSDKRSRPTTRIARYASKSRTGTAEWGASFPAFGCGDTAATATATR